MKNDSLAIIAEEYQRCCDLYTAIKKDIAEIVETTQQQGVILKFKGRDPSNVWPHVDNVVNALKIEVDAALSDTCYTDSQLLAPSTVTMVGCNDSSWIGIAGNSMRADLTDGRSMLKDPKQGSNREFITTSLSTFNSNGLERWGRSNHNASEWQNLDTDFAANPASVRVLQLVSDLSLARCKLGALCIANARIDQAIAEKDNPECTDPVKAYKDFIAKFEKVRKGMQRKQYTALDPSKPEDRNAIVDHMINGVSGKEAPYTIPYRSERNDVKGVQSLSYNKAKPEELDNNAAFWEQIQQEHTESMNQEAAWKNKQYNPDQGLEAFCKHACETGIIPSVPGIDFNAPKLLDTQAQAVQYTDGNNQLHADIPALVYIKAMRAVKKGTFWVVTAQHNVKPKWHYYNVKTVQPVLTPTFFYNASRTDAFTTQNNCTYSNPFDDLNTNILLPEFNRKRKRENLSEAGARVFAPLCVQQEDDAL